MPAGKIEPSQQRFRFTAGIAVGRRHEYVVEFKTLCAVDGHDLDGIRSCGTRLRVEVDEKRAKVLRSTPLSGSSSLAERREKRAGVS